LQLRDYGLGQMADLRLKALGRSAEFGALLKANSFKTSDVSAKVAMISAGLLFDPVTKEVITVDARGKVSKQGLGGGLAAEGVLVVSDAAARLATVGVFYIFQNDVPGILWSLIASDSSLVASWIGIPYTTEASGEIVISMSLANFAAIVPAANVLGHVGGVPSIGDGSTTGGMLMPPPLILSADPVAIGGAVSISGTLLNGGTTLVLPVGLLSYISAGVWNDGTWDVSDNGDGTGTIIRDNSSTYLGFNFGSGSVIGNNLGSFTAYDGSETGTPVVTYFPATVAVPGQLAIIADGGVWVLRATGVWHEIV
jgi:hypothetical protein